MYYSLSFNSISGIKQAYPPAEFSGSSAFRMKNNELQRKTKPRKSFEFKQLNLITTEGPDEIPFKKLNKSKLKNKICAFFNLEASARFCAFYSISFPLHLSDNMAYQLFNTWLTRCRKLQGLLSYLWVAERQKNGTIHFHMITNCFMNIKAVNGYMKQSLITQSKNGTISATIEELNKYNGVDVDNLYKSKRHKSATNNLSRNQSRKKLNKYLTKYITKNEIKSVRLPWHCSRDISALFTSQLITDDEDNQLTLNVRTTPSNYLIYDRTEVVVYIPLYEIDIADHTDLREINNRIHRMFFENKYK